MSQFPDKTGPIWQGIRYLRDLFLPSSGLMIGENRIQVKKDVVQDLWYSRPDGSEISLSGSPASARVYNSANISINDSTNTELTFDSERYDTDTIHSTASNTGRLTAMTVGKYSIKANIRWDPDNDGRRYISILLNGTTVIATDSVPAVQGAATHQNISTDYNLAVADYVEVRVYHTAGAALNVGAASNYSPEFMMTRMGPVGTAVPAVGDDHGGLTGLTDDDHGVGANAYLLASGSRAGSTGAAQDFGSNGIKADVIAESTGAAGVTGDGVKLKDGSVVIADAGYLGSVSDPDAIQIEADGDVVLTQDLAVTGTLAAGETTLADGASLNLQEAITFTGATTENIVEFPDNLADALSFEEGGTAYMTFVTTDAGEKVTFGKSIDVTGNIVVSGTVDGVDIAARDHAKYTGAEAIAAVEGEATLAFGQATVISTTSGDLTLDPTGDIVLGGHIKTGSYDFYGGGAGNSMEFYGGARAVGGGGKLVFSGSGIAVSINFYTPNAAKDADVQRMSILGNQDSGSGEIRFYEDLEFQQAAVIRTTAGDLTLAPNGGKVIIPDAGYIGSVSDTDAIQIEADGDVVLTQDLYMGDDKNIVFGAGSDWTVNYDESVDNQLLFQTTNTSAVATTDPMFEILVGGTPTANQQVFGVAKGTQASNTPLFTVDEDGDIALPGNIDIGAAGIISANTATKIEFVFAGPVKIHDDFEITGDWQGEIRLDAGPAYLPALSVGKGDANTKAAFQIREGDTTGGAGRWKLGFGPAQDTMDSFFWRRAAATLSFGDDGGSTVSMMIGDKVAPSATLHVDQKSTSGAQPTLLLDQADTDEDLLSIIGTSITTVADATLVEHAEVAAAGAITGWMKVHVVDTRAGGIAEADYYSPLYAAPTMT